MRFFRTFAVLMIVALAGQVSASAAEPRVYLFWGASCPHSQAARSFLLKQRERDPNLQLLELETEGSLINAVLLSKLLAKIGLPELTVVPTVVVGSSITIGYIDDAITGQEIMDTIAACRKDGCRDVIEQLIDELDQPVQAKLPPRRPTTCRAEVEVAILP